MTLNTLAHVTALRAALTSAGVLNGNAQAPKAGGWSGAEGSSPFVPYVAVYLIPNGPRTGPLGSFDDADLVVQFSGVGAHPDQALDIVGKAVDAVIGTHLTVTGRRVYVSSDLSAGVTRDDDVRPPLFVAVERIRLTTSG